MTFAERIAVIDIEEILVKREAMKRGQKGKRELQSGGTSDLGLSFC